MLKLRNALQHRLLEATTQAFPLADVVVDFPLSPATKPEFGDFQANGAMGLAKVLGRPPRRIAQAVVDQLHVDDLCHPPQVAGPGFINFTVRAEVLAAEVEARLDQPRLGVPTAQPQQRVVVDFSSPNIAKEMHVGHLRSTVIGDCIARLLSFLGHRVVRLNHLGDWGTQFGMLIAHLKHMAPRSLSGEERVELGDLVAFYRQAKERFDEDEAFQEQSRREVVNLQAGEPESLRAWQLLCQQSRKAFQAIYDRLDVHLVERGESFYNQALPGVVEDLEQARLLVVDDGARCVFLEGMTAKDGQPLPLIVQKRDGGYNYATTDLAAIRQRLASPDAGGEGAERVVYVTDAGQSNHFAAVFQVAQRAGWVPKGCRLQHVPFGLVQGADGKKLKTRSGATVRLQDLLDEAVDRARRDLVERMAQEQRQNEEDFIAHVAETVGIAAVKYADLSQNRTTNYQFNFDRMLSLQGNTAPYLLYAYVRIQGIARQGGSLVAAAPGAICLQAPQELNLARQLLNFDEVILEMEQDLLPNRLCSYLFGLSQTFNRFYDQLPVLKAPEPSRATRLALCRLSARTMNLGLALLGIKTLDRM
ncbi:arginine--tRNA ligase [Candidatus Synechococcus spongiarum]|uniref:Arginine--tRNA ligase n=2 Tax=Candidatus Synechococcus spongiarum TaxID=431041 RepID=A0A1T1D214_9SYNE|nr:arginine--tRNA ligase [Candidatus Synechococcus spongiarum]OOV34860.1 arginine--tRNA ligase [Candidatus Synechococcus spongiarum LMB bulk15N]OOV34877.1 arginine--tRNA ligase [Candidatus Synechococcus spongiarum LMB bulk15M]